MISRRRFLTSTAATVLGSTIGNRVNHAVAVGKESRVVIVRNPAMMTGAEAFNESAVASTLDAGLCRFGGTKTAVEVLTRYVKPDDVVGLKINACFGQRMNATRLEVVKPLCNLLVQAGVKENNIIIWDRCVDELEGCGYQINDGKSGVRCLASLTRKVNRGGKPFVGFCEEVVTLGDVTTRYARLASEECSVIINMPVLKSYGEMDGRLLGVTGALKNHIGSIEVTSDNVRALHRNGCQKSISDLWLAKPLRQKTKLIICDGIFPLFNTGPGDDPRYHDRHNALIIAEDPVAMDTAGLAILNNLRTKYGLDRVESSYLSAAGEHGIGNSSSDQIELLESNLPA